MQNTGVKVDVLKFKNNFAPILGGIFLYRKILNMGISFKSRAVPAAVIPVRHINAGLRFRILSHCPEDSGWEGIETWKAGRPAWNNAYSMLSGIKA